LRGSVRPIFILLGHIHLSSGYSSIIIYSSTLKMVDSYSLGNVLELFGYLTIDVFDKDMVNADDFLGRVMVPLRSLSAGTESVKESWHDLRRRAPKDNVRGQICLRLELDVEYGIVSNSSYHLSTQLYIVLITYTHAAQCNCKGKTIIV